MKKIELLSPARDFETGMAAVNHGADAVYIGGPGFGARLAAANQFQDVERLASYAHKYRARVYLTLNTILFDNELEDAAALVRGAWNAGVDALIVQDMAYLEMDLPPIPLIASTQMNNTDVAHIKFLEKAGFMRAILARELSIEQIRRIRKESAIELECFVHGALCVGLSGRCYLSAAIGGRSANRGMCAQPCRLAWRLFDAGGSMLRDYSYILSLKDMDRSAYLEDLIDAGVTSFKIEGRLKDAAYVKNTTALYRKMLDGIIDSRKDLKSSSSGRTVFFFEPDPRKTFHRGATPYFSGDDIASQGTAKSIGELLGVAGKTGTNYFSFLDGRKAESINNGDGLCFFDGAWRLCGMQVVKVVEGRVLVHKMPEGLIKGVEIFRNHDHEFLRKLEGNTSDRKIALRLKFSEIPDGFELSGEDEDGISASVMLQTAKQPATNPEASAAGIRKQVSKLGGTIFSLSSFELESGPFFLTAAQLNAMRRELAERLEASRMKQYERPLRESVSEPDAAYPEAILDYNYNVGNEAARNFYLKHGVSEVSPAFEVVRPAGIPVVMTSRLCLRRLLGACPKQKGYVKLDEPLTIENSGRKFALRFDCSRCIMMIVQMEDE
jgi:putative protease